MSEFYRDVIIEMSVKRIDVGWVKFDVEDIRGGG
jgi:hypothetical protein